MGFDMDEDILQDFLVEAGEILELLSEQLVQLENNPDDSDLLNAIFRGFHTVKGGAGFLSLEELVDVCHQAENLFDLLRNGQRQVNPDMMDNILQALDVINEMFTQVQNREPLTPADSSLIEKLSHFCSQEYDPDASNNDMSHVAEHDVTLTGDHSDNKTTAQQTHSADKSQVEDRQNESISSTSDLRANADLFIEVDGLNQITDHQETSSIEEISEGEFEALLDELHGDGKGPNSSDFIATTSDLPPEQVDGDDITEDDFEALLDELHGKGSFDSGLPQNKPSSTSPPSVEYPSASNAIKQSNQSQSESTADDEITDEEFETLLDNLHGEGQGPNRSVAPSDKPKKSDPQPSIVAPATPAKVEPPKKDTISSNKQIESQPTTKAKPTSSANKGAGSQAVQTETTVRVDTKRLDQIMNMVGELVLVRNRLVSLGISIDSEDMSKAISNLDVVTADLQGAVMKTRMQPIKKVFGRFPRVVRDLARSLKKEIDLQLVGEDTDLDKNLVEALADPLVHLVRNSVDHGIEMPAERVAAGKPRTGSVKLSASQEGDHILLTIEDDGAGMDPEKLKRIAIDRGVLDVDAAARMSDNDAYNLIFAPGFSTKVEISDISGRGVGMDVVKTKITQLNGTVFIDSQLGKGTVLEIKVPLTLAILPTLMVMVGKQTFALPLAAVSEIFHLDLSKTNIVDGQLTIIVREKAIPLFYLQHWLVKESGAPIGEGQGHIVIVQIGNQQVGFVVDSLIGQEEVVIKPLDALLQGTPGMAGATITSDGGIALILDIPNLLKHYAHTSKNYLR